MTIDETSLSIACRLLEIGIAESRIPCVVGTHSAEPLGDGQVTLWLRLDDGCANDGTGILAIHVDESEVPRIIDRIPILRALTGYDHIR